MVSLELRGKTLHLLHGEKTVYSLREGEVALYLGIGDSEYLMSHGSFKISESFRQRVRARAKKITVEGGIAKVYTNSGHICISCENDRFKFTPVGYGRYNRMLIRIPSTANESVYGGGENFTEFNLHGKRLNVWVAEHKSVPPFILLLYNRGENDLFQRIFFLIPFPFLAVFAC